MKIAKIERVGKLPVYDISVADVAHYALKNGVVVHNSGILLSSDAAWIIGRSQEKDGTELSGYNFTIRIEKSRHVAEKKAIPITVKFEGGISRYTGLIDIAIAAGAVVKPSNGWYSIVDLESGEVDSKKYRLKDTDNKEFWEPILKQKKFTEWIANEYKVSTGSLLSDEDTEKAIAGIMELEDDI